MLPFEVSYRAPFQIFSQNTLTIYSAATSRIFAVNNNATSLIPYVLQHIERVTLRLWAFVDIDENIQKIVKKTITIFDLFFSHKF